MIELGLPELLLAAITVISPIFTAIANQSKWSPKTKNMVAFVVSIILAVIYLAFTGGLTDLNDLPGTVLAVYGLQQLVYKQFMQELAKKVEAVTSVKPGEKVVVEEGEKNVVEDTGEENKAQVDVVDTPATPAEQPEQPARADRILG